MEGAIGRMTGDLPCVALPCRYLRWPMLHFERGFEALLAKVAQTGDAAGVLSQALAAPSKPRAMWRDKHLRIRGSLCDGFWVRALHVIVIGTWAALNGLPFYTTQDHATDAYYSPSDGPSGWEHYFEPIGDPLPQMRAGVPENATLELDCDSVNKAFAEVDSTIAPGGYANGTIYPERVAHARPLRLLRAAQVRRFVRVRAEMQAKADAEWSRITHAAAHRSVLGVHMRGTDAYVAKPSAQADFFAMIDAYVAAHGGQGAVLIFLATDDTRFVTAARERFGESRVQLQNSGAVVRGSAEMAVWKDNNGTQNLRRGTEVLLDTLLLSRCDFLLKSGSAVLQLQWKEWPSPSPSAYSAPRLGSKVPRAPFSGVAEPA